MKEIIIIYVLDYVITVFILWLITLLLNISFSIRIATAIWLILGLIGKNTEIRRKNL